MKSLEYKENKQFKSGISKYGYDLYNNQYMFYIEFFEESHHANIPEYSDDKLEKHINNPNNVYYDAYIYRIYKIEHIITKKKLKKYRNNIKKITYKVGEISYGYISYYRSYDIAINNKLSLKMFPKLYKNGISQYRKIYDQYGNLIKEYYHNNDKIEGIYKKYITIYKYYTKSTIQEYKYFISQIRNYMNGNLHGEWKFYNEKGQILEYSLYRNNICIQRYQHIYKDDKIYIKNIINYINGKMEGKIKTYNLSDYMDDDHIIYKETNHINGQKNGISKKYIDNQLTEVSNYKNNKLIGYKLTDTGFKSCYYSMFSLTFYKIIKNKEVLIMHYHLDYNIKNRIFTKILFYTVFFANFIKLYKFI